MPQVGRARPTPCASCRKPRRASCCSSASSEDLATCVDRELREETGYALRTDADADAPALDPLPQAGYSSTGLTDETVHVVFAQVEKVADAQPEPAEFIEPFLLPIADVPRFLAENETPIGTRAQLVLEAFARRR